MRRRWTGLGICLLALLAAPAKAGLIFGTIRWEDPNVPTQGLPIEVQCAKNAPHGGHVEERGDYKIYVPEVGNCVFTVTVGERRLTSEVGSYEDEVRYDFLIVRTTEGPRLVRQ